MEARQVVQPAPGPRSSGRHAAQGFQRNDSPSRPQGYGACSSRGSVQSSTRRSPPAQGGVAAGSSSCLEVALKSTRTAAGKAQLAAAAQKRGRGEGSKGIRLEDSSTPEAAKRRCQEKPPVTYGLERPCFEDTYEESDDSNESFDGPFSGSSSAVAASSTTADTPPAAQ